MQKMKNLVVIVGPTGVGKTELSLQLAERLQAPIISADSRQVYRELPICSAAPTLADQQRVQHYLVGIRDMTEAYSAAQFESDAMRIMADETADNVVMCGGSMMYVDAVCRGISDMPSVNPEVRAALRARLESEGLDSLLAQLEELDPAYFAQVDRKNPQRVVHGLEMCLSTGRPFSSFRTGQVKPRPFRIIKIGLTRPREELYDRIARRVDQMVADGLEAETRRVYDKFNGLEAVRLQLPTISQQLSNVVRNPGPTQAQPIPNLLPTALNTVGLKEMLLFFEGIYSRERALERIVHNSQVYSKKQMTWFGRDDSIHWFAPHQQAEIWAFLNEFVCSRT